MTSPPAAPQLRRRVSNPFVASLLSAGLLWLAFPPADRGFLGWFVVSPLLSLVRSESPAWRVYLACWSGSLLFGMLSMSWVMAADVGGAFWMGLFMSLWWPIFLLPARLGVRRLRLPLMIVAPVCWVGMEYLRAHILSGFPWYYLAHTQYAYLAFIQVCDVAGAWGLSFLMVMANVLWLDLVTLPLMLPPDLGGKLVPTQKIKVLVVFGLIFATVGYGVARLSTSRFRPGPRLALLQSDFLQGLKNEGRAAEMISRIESLIDKASKVTPPPDLIVWPETTYPPGFVEIHPNLPEDVFARLAKGYDDQSSPEKWRLRQGRIHAYLHGLVDSLGIPMLIGATSFDFQPHALERFNSAGLFVPGRPEVARYDKQALVPVGEYFPFIETLPWLISLTPYTDGYVPSLTHGRGPKVMESGGVRYAPLICFEDTIPQVSLAAGRQTPRPDVFVNLTNDGWFRDTSEQKVHLAISVFRAVELRTPLARAVNTGISAMIDGDGRIIDSLPPNKEAVLTANVPLDGRFSPYRVIGDSLGLGCLAVMLGFLPVAAFYPRHLTPLAQATSVG